MKAPMLIAYQWLVGLGDTGTGLLLLFAPTLTLRLMGVALAPTPIVFASFVGVFVLGVGISYLVLLPVPREAARWEAQWLVTALIRSLVALFLCVEVATGRMEGAWLAVALTDGVLAVTQWTGLKRGWLGHAF